MTQDAARAERQQRRDHRVVGARALLQPQLDHRERDLDLGVGRVLDQDAAGVELGAAQEWRAQHGRADQQVERELGAGVIRRRRMHRVAVITR
jgi:hypothetical protein